jgi:integrase
MTEDRAIWINGFATGKTWQNKLGSKLTKQKFAGYFKIYCDTIEKTPDQLIAIKIEGLQNVGTEKEFQAENLLENFFAESKMLPTAKLMLKNAVFSFYKHNRRALEGQTASNIKNETPESKKRNPSLEDLVTLESVCRSARDKALIWFIASTSCRIGTVSLLKWSDLKPTENDNVPFMLEIESSRLKGAGIGKYKGLKQITFLHKFAHDKLEAYKQEAQKKGYDLKPDSPLFIAYWSQGKIRPLTSKAMGCLFDDFSLAAWGDLEKKRFSPHDLREFFQSALESAKIQENLIAPVMAHKVKGIAASYSSHEIEELLKNYESALPYLVPKSVPELEAQLEKNEEEKDKRIKFLEQRLLDNGLNINKMMGNIEALTKEMAELREKPLQVKID